MTTSIDLLSPSASGPETEGLRGVYGRFPTGVMAICAMHEDDPVGFAASSFNTVSMSPPLVAVSVQRGSGTWPLLAASPRIGLSVLADDQLALCTQLSKRTFDRFVGAEWSATADGAVLVEGAAAWLECSLDEAIPVGDHEMAILRVRRFACNGDKRPLVFHDSRFHGLAGLGDWPSEAT